MITNSKSRLQKKFVLKVIYFIGAYMKKLLMVAALVVAGQMSADWKTALGLAKEPVAAPVKVGFVAKAKAKVAALPADTAASLRAKISANPLTSVAVAMVAAIVLENVASFVYNNYVASNDVNEEDEDLDIA